MIEIKTEIFGSKPIQAMFDLAPRAYTRGVKTWLAKEQSGFVGSKRKKGAWQKLLERKRLAGGRGGRWSSRVSNTFKGYISGANQIQGMRLTMGVGLRSENSYLSGIVGMQDGYSQTSETRMPIPNYQGLEAAGVNNKFYVKFKEMLAQKKLDIVRSNGRVYFFQRGEVGRLLFTGVGKMTVPKQFDFYSTWSRRLPKVLERGQKQIETVTNNIASGKKVFA
jgi:hypothetical protein